MLRACFLHDNSKYTVVVNWLTSTFTGAKFLIGLAKFSCQHPVNAVLASQLGQSLVKQFTVV